MGLDGPLLLRRLEEEKIKLYCLVSVSLVTLSVALHWLGPVMVPLILAFMLSYMLSPLVDLQVQKLRCPQVRSVAGQSIPSTDGEKKRTHARGGHIAEGGVSQTTPDVRICRCMTVHPLRSVANTTSGSP